MNNGLDDDSLFMERDSKRNRKSLFDDLDEMNRDDYQSFINESSTLIDTESFHDEPKETKKEKKSKSATTEEDWFSEFVNGLDSVIDGSSAKKRKSYFIDEDEGLLLGVGKKKKKKKKKKGQPTDYKKEFEPENLLFTNILRDTTRFIDTLQREYDAITSKKGSGRGTTKNTQDLVANINSARQLAMSLIDKKVNLKKLAADLTMKERKELGLNDGSGTDLGEYGSAYLKKLIDERRSIFSGGREDVLDLGDDQDADNVVTSVHDLLDDAISAEISDEEAKLYGVDERTEEADLYLKYENDDIKVKVRINRENSEEYEFYAETPDGEIVDDYPLPVSKLESINRSTGIATDEFGQKYFITWE